MRRNATNLYEVRYRCVKEDANLSPIILCNLTVYLLFSNSYLFPLINLEGPQLELPRLVSKMKFETKEDYEKYFSRLGAFPRQVQYTRTWISVVVTYNNCALIKVVF